MSRIAFLVVMMTFFAVLALDITVPAVVLGAMALSNWIVLSSMPVDRMRERAA